MIKIYKILHSRDAWSGNQANSVRKFAKNLKRVILFIKDKILI